MTDETPTTVVADGAVFAVLFLATALAAALGALTLWQADQGLPRELLHHDVTLGLHALFLGWAGFTAIGLAVASASLLLSGRDTRWPAIELAGLLAAGSAVLGALAGLGVTWDFWGAFPAADPLLATGLVFVAATALWSLVAIVLRVLASRRVRLVADVFGWSFAGLLFAALAVVGPTVHTPPFW